MSEQKELGILEVVDEIEKRHFVHIYNSDLDVSHNMLSKLIKHIKFLETTGYSMSAELSYLARLVQLYEEEIPSGVQASIKKFIFSEDDR